MAAAVSRYRSQRKPQDDSPPPPADGLNASPLPNDAVARSRSRYRRKDSVGQRPPTAGAQPEARSSPGVIPTAKPVRYNGQLQARQLQHHQAGPSQPIHTPDQVQVDSYDQKTKATAEQGPGSGTERISAPANLHSSPQRPAAEALYRQPTTQDLFPPPSLPSPPRDEAPRSGDISATKTSIKQPQYEFEKRRDSDGGGCFGLFKRKKQQQQPISSAGDRSSTRPVTSKETRDNRAGGGGVAVGIDAPVSAVNAGDRRVSIHFGGRHISLPVTPTTTCIDLIKSSNVVLSDRFDVKSAVLLEDFSTVGVQRPLRRYEHIRDVMNSWDNDQQNNLILVDPGTGKSEAELSVQGVPREQPGDESWFLYYSQRPGKWDGRFITLRQDGQLLISKDLERPHDAQTLCHLSDFDIYTPTLDKLRKKVKPPKKHCFAIKSQQKSNMFESSDKFVHFFSTAEKRDADAFYGAIQGWRSWYLVNVLGEGTKGKGSPPANAAEAQEARAGAQRDHPGGGSGGHKKGNSVDSHYQLGSFQPLIDVDFNNFGDDARPPTRSRNLASGTTPNHFSTDSRAHQPERSRSTRQKHNAPLLKKGVLAEDEPLANLDLNQAHVEPRRDVIPSSDAKFLNKNDFADTGFPSRTYSQRLASLDEHDQSQRRLRTSGSSLVNGRRERSTGDSSDAGRGPSIDLRRETSVRNKSGVQRLRGDGELSRSRSTRERESADLQRSGSRRGEGFPSRPLVDLTPQSYEPPQFQKKSGHGFKPAQVGPGGLIDSATSPEDPIGVPASTDWRGRNTQYQQDFRAPRARSHSSPRQSVPTRSHSQHRPTTAARSRQPPIPPSHEDEAFTGEGLLASADGAGWGSAQRGRGIMNGSHAKGPMIDMSQESQFVQGSLLNRVEREQGGPLAANLIIDREK